ncbi:nucleotidyltransferase domain-containing protein [Bythopirellula polymerisocia]|uniref:Putative nucleotidyltransferase n=1 Tax=Bythopirellula polymerisocia TaxID=2528003 RepID=A0A5C6D6D1_9BACT|nr:nucleotidyltransferase domain-containing protein [Bythopirellula polymerisocia]TWU30429.1 putative nucleotidyltransferase [Bythopirellula polymerisocia]
MKSRVHNSPNLIYSVGTQVVALKQVQGSNGEAVHPAGAVGVVVRSPGDRQHSYRIRFVDGFEAALHHDNLMLLAKYKQGAINDSDQVLSTHGLFDRVIYRCVVGSRAFGLDTGESDTDRRGIYLPPADLHWSLYGVPDQLENDDSEECYWELQKFLVMALKGNPNILECLYTPLVEHATPLAKELLAMRDAFLSRLVYQTYNGYVMSQFKRMQADLRNQGKVKPKHVMHLIRLLLSGIHVLREGFVPVDVGEYRERLFAIKNETMPWDDIEVWRKELHKVFDRALSETKLPERPDYERANDFLVKARRLAVAEELP